jgi:hypothetical protein
MPWIMAPRYVANLMGFINPSRLTREGSSEYQLHTMKTRSPNTPHWIDRIVWTLDQLYDIPPCKANFVSFWKQVKVKRK